MTKKLFQSVIEVYFASKHKYIEITPLKDTGSHTLSSAGAVAKFGSMQPTDNQLRTYQLRDCNEEFSILTGWTNAEMTGKDFVDITSATGSGLFAVLYDVIRKHSNDVCENYSESKKKYCLISGYTAGKSSFWSLVISQL